MARHTVASGNSRYRSACSRGRAFEGRGSKIPADFERRCFEYDRKLVAVVIDTLRDVIHNGAIEMGMVIDNRIARMAHRLDRMGSELDALMVEVGDASGYPKLPTDKPVTPAVVRRLPVPRA